MIREYATKDFNSVSILGRDINLNYKFKLSEVGRCYIYELNDEVVGFVIIDVFSDRAEIVDIVVALLHRNKKIGDALLKMAIEVATELGSKSITLEVKCDNNFAIKLYKSNNFKIASVRKKYYSNGTIDAYLMYREL